MRRGQAQSSFLCCRFATWFRFFLHVGACGLVRHTADDVVRRKVGQPKRIAALRIVALEWRRELATGNEEIRNDDMVCA
jgi:hypothetical protein